jgi:signal transduction histidine kinase
MQERALRVGGEVNIGSQPGHGTRVVVSIPTAKEAA